MGISKDTAGGFPGTQRSWRGGWWMQEDKMGKKREVGGRRGDRSTSKVPLVVSEGPWMTASEQEKKHRDTQRTAIVPICIESITVVLPPRMSIKLTMPGNDEMRRMVTRKDCQGIPWR
ncbi:hypothetical protein C8J57DRAFT_1253025 [Mycena rebaudengoi]|nr:hypothetical protein C8J57DRAFT_1253025 [Mycena rebaudengoi]